jgi:hypothetical protein
LKIVCKRLILCDANALLFVKERRRINAAGETHAPTAKRFTGRLFDSRT